MMARKGPNAWEHQVIKKVEPTKKRKIVSCPKCGRRHVETNKKHLDSPICVVTASQNAMRDRGLMPVNKRYVDMLKANGVEVLFAPQRADFASKQELRSGEKGWVHKVTHDNFAPIWVVHVVQDADIQQAVRWACIRNGLYDRDFQIALEMMREINYGTYKAMVADKARAG